MCFCTSYDLDRMYGPVNADDEDENFYWVITTLMFYWNVDEASKKLIIDRRIIKNNKITAAITNQLTVNPTPMSSRFHHQFAYTIIERYNRMARKIAWENVRILHRNSKSSSLLKSRFSEYTTAAALDERFPVTDFSRLSTFIARFSPYLVPCFFFLYFI